MSGNGPRRQNRSGDERAAPSVSRPVTARDVEDALDVPMDRLEYFVEFHPDPSVEAVLTLAGRPTANQDVRDVVAAWLGEQAEGGEE